jgi:hypothetical protein
LRPTSVGGIAGPIELVFTAARLFHNQIKEAKVKDWRG